MSAVLHYIYDPQCGWCYAAEPLAWAASGVEHLTMELHGGALWPQPTHLPESMRGYIREADARIEKMTGQPFGAPYVNGLFLDPSMVLDSRPTTAAVLAARALDPSKALAMLKGMQHAHYEHGLRVVEPQVLADVAVQVGLDRDAFMAAWKQAAVDEHIERSRELMGQLGAQGFPFFALQVGDDWYPVPHSRFAATPAQFRDWLRTQVQALAPRH